MMRGRPRVLVFCDLDSLLAPTPGLPAGRSGTLEHLEARGTVLVLCSHRTRAEIDWFAQQLKVSGPIVAEHGGAVFVPAGLLGHVPGSRPVAGYDTIEFGRSYASVVERLRKAAARVDVPVRGMADMSIEEAAHALGVPLPLARLAKLREYTELFQVDPAHRHLLFTALRSVHLHCREGEPLHCAGATVDASLGVALLRNLFRRTADTVVSVGIADAATDPDLLRLVDHPVPVSTRSVSTQALPASIADAVTEIVSAIRLLSASVRGRTLYDGFS